MVGRGWRSNGIVLQAKRMPFVTLTVPGTTTLFYERYGAHGVPILFLHGGWGYSLYPIDFQLLALLQKHEVWIPRRSGYGRSSRVHRFEPTFHKIAALEMLAFLESCNISRCVVWGHSDGAVIAAWMGLLEPQRLCGLVLEAFHFYRRKERSIEFFSMAATRPQEVGEKAQLILQSEHGDNWRDVIRISGEAWLRLILGEEQTADLYQGHLYSLSVPTLLIHSQNDPRTEPLEIKDAVKHLPTAACHVLDAGGHSPHSHPETRELCTQLIQSFAAEVTSPPQFSQEQAPLEKRIHRKNTL